MQDSARRLSGPPRAALLAFDGPVPTLAYAVPFAIVWIVAAASLLTVFADDLLIVNEGISTLGTGPDLLGVAIVVVIIAVVHGFALTAATLAILARIDGRRLTVRDAWRGALRRPGSIALAAAALLVVIAVVLSVTVLISLQPFLGVAVAIAIFIVGIVVAPLLLAWPLIVARKQPFGAALVAAWRSPRAFFGRAAEPLGSPRFAVTLTFLAAGVITFVIGWLGGLLPLGWWTPVVAVALSILPAALTQLLLVAVAARGAALRLKEPFESEASGDAPPAEARGAGALAGIAVLAVPAVVAGLLIAVNPWQVPAYAAADTPHVWRAAQIASWDGGTVLLSRLGGEESSARLCDGATCGPSHDMRSILPTAIAAAADGGVLSASWYPIEGTDRSEGSFELRVTHSTPEALDRWSEPRSDDATADQPSTWEGFPGEERVLGSIDSTFEGGEAVFTRSNESRMAVAIDTTGPSPVIASIVRPNDSDATLALDFCADATCSTSTRTTLEVDWALSVTNAATLDVASAEDGRSAVVTLTQREADGYGSPLRVMTATADGEWTTEILDADLTGAEGGDMLDFSYGAQVARDADGMPVILSRAAGDPALRLFFCTDAACTDATVTDIAPDTKILHAPALAIDSTGRPLIGTVDGSGNIALLSCDDAVCEDRTMLPLMATAPTKDGFTDGFALSVDDQGHPLLAVGTRRAGSTAKASSNGTILACTAARCGAD